MIRVGSRKRDARRRFLEALEELEELAREDPVLVGRVLRRLGPDGLLVEYLLARRGVRVGA